MEEKINVFSEIGVLKSVVLHRPSWELATITPDVLQEVLFEDIPWMKKMRLEHNCFANTLRGNGVNVVYLEDMLTELFKKEEAKRFVCDYICNEELSGCDYAMQVKEFLYDKSGNEFLKYVLGGIDTEDMNQAKEPYRVYLNSIPNLYFTRDMAAVAGEKMIISVPYTRVRFRESVLQQALLLNAYYVDKDAYYDRSIASYNLECGDVLVLNEETLCVGVSERTSFEAVKVLAQRLFKSESSFKQVLAVEIPQVRSCMHLDTVFTMIDYNKFVVYPGIIDSLKLTLLSKGQNGIDYHAEDDLHKALEKVMKADYIKLIASGGTNPRYSAREQWNDSTNTLALAPGSVITYDRNEITNELLDKEGIKVSTIPGSELVRGRGGPRCMSMPLYRERVKQ